MRVSPRVVRPSPSAPRTRSSRRSRHCRGPSALRCSWCMSSTVGCPGLRLKRASASLPRRSFPPCRLCPLRSIPPRWAEPCVAWMSLDRSMPWWLTQTRTRVHPQVHPAADGVPLWRDCDRLANDVQVAPALGQAALALERCAATVPVHQVHRRASVVGGVDGGQPAAGPLLEGGLLASRDRVPELGDHS